jgi:hypothetical protein
MEMSRSEYWGLLLVVAITFAWVAVENGIYRREKVAEAVATERARGDSLSKVLRKVDSVVMQFHWECVAIADVQDQLEGVATPPDNCPKYAGDVVGWKESKAINAIYEITGHR